MRTTVGVSVAIVLAVVLAVVLLNAHAAPARVPVWIDTDPAMGEPERDVDDGLALVQAFHSPELDIRGVSVVFGNAPLDRGLTIARRLVRDFGLPRLRVFSGAAEVVDPPIATEASRALAAALRAAPLTILALGPATNVATTLAQHPDLVPRVTRVIAVAGRRPGQRFTTGTSNARGHRDFNFELDPRSFQVLLDSKVEIVLAPFEISSKIWLKGGDLDRLAASGSAASRAIAAPARAWLSLWVRLFGVDGFNPFDTLAVAYAVSPDGFACETLPARIETLADDVTEPGVQGVQVDRKPYLLASKDLRERASARHVLRVCAGQLQRRFVDEVDAMRAPRWSRRPLVAVVVALALVALPRADFDHDHLPYARVIRDYVQPPFVDYSALKKGRAALDASVEAFAQPTQAEEQSWPREQRLAFWINAYNAFTLRAIVDHYPIRGSWLTLRPRSSIRQIDGVWTAMVWQAAGRRVSLDDIEHRILRAELREPRIHFAINCASISCPPLAREPYRASTLDAQLDEAARRYLASPEGLRIEGDTLRVSSLLRWYGGDFVERFASLAPERPDPTERAILGVIVRFGSPEAVALARRASVRVRFLDYDWSLNDVR